MTTVNFLLTLCVAILRLITGVKGTCYAKQHIATALMKSFDAHIPIADIWCRINPIHDTGFVDSIFFSGQDQATYQNMGWDDIKLIFKIPKDQQKQKIVLTFLDDESKLTHAKVREYSRYYQGNKVYNTSMDSDIIWQNEIEFNTNIAPFTTTVNQTIIGKDKGGNTKSALNYLIELKVDVMWEKTNGCRPATNSTTNRTNVTQNSTSLTTNVIYHPGSSNEIIKLELETEIDDNLFELDKTDKVAIQKKCQGLIVLAGCSQCLVAVEKLQKTHLPIKLTRRSQRVKRQRPSLSSIRKVLKSFFQAMPLDIKLSPQGSARIIGGKEADRKDSTDENETYKILMIIFIITTIVLLIMIVFYWIKTCREKAKKQMERELNQEHLIAAECYDGELEYDQSMTMADSNIFSREASILKAALQQRRQMTTNDKNDQSQTLKPIHDTIIVQLHDPKNDTMTKTDKRKLTEEEQTCITKSSVMSGTNQSVDIPKINTQATYPVAMAAIVKLEKKPVANESVKEKTIKSEISDGAYDKVDKQFIKKS